MRRTKSISIFLTISTILNNQLGNFMGGGDGGSGDGGSGDSGSGDGNGSGDGAGGSGDSGSGIQYAYPEGFDEKLRGDASLIKFADEKGNFNVAGIMKSYVHAQGMMGKDKIGLPDETWTDDQYSELYNKLGRPSDIKEYNIDNNAAEGIDKNEDFHNSFKEIAHKSGLAPKQAQAMSDFFNNFVGESVGKNNEMAKAAADIESNQLRQDWGDKYDHKNKRAFSALQNFASEAEIAEMGKKGMLNNTSIVRLFDKIANGMAEDSLKVEGSNTFGMTGEEAARTIESYYKPGHPFVTRGHPEQKFYQGEMKKLQGIKLASKRS